MTKPKFNISPPKQPMTKREFYQWVNSKDMRLSHSSFSNFMETPHDFLDYKLKAREISDPMIKGTLEHAIVLEPDKVDDMFFVAPNVPLTSNKNKEIYLSFLYETCQTIGVAESVLKDGETIEGWKDKRGYYEQFCKQYIVKQEWVDFARMMRDRMYRNSAASDLLNAAPIHEGHAKWEAFGFNWQGYIDMNGQYVVADLKRVPDASPRKVDWVIRDRKLAHQAAHYTFGAGNEGKHYFILAFDQSLHITVRRIPKEEIEKAWRDIEYYCLQFKRCRFANSWEESYNFYSDKNIYANPTDTKPLVSGFYE